MIQNDPSFLVGWGKNQSVLFEWEFEKDSLGYLEGDIQSISSWSVKLWNSWNWRNRPETIGASKICRSDSGRSPNLTLAMQQSAALLMEKSMPMGVGKLKDMNISRCGETGWKLRCRHVGSMWGYVDTKIDSVWLVCKAHCMVWIEMKRSFFDFLCLFIARIVVIAMYMKTTHTHTHTHHMFDDRNRHKISQHMILWRGCFEAPSVGCTSNSGPKSPEFVSSTYGNRSLLKREMWAAFMTPPPPRPLVTIVPNICRYKMALEGLESLVGHGVAGPQEAKGTGGCKTVDAGSSKMMRLQLSKPLFWELRMYQNVISCTRDDDVS